MIPTRSSSRRLLVCAVLAVATLAVYLPVVEFGFLSYDDDEYVSANPFVQNGISGASIRWAFTTGRAANWHPLTWISHMLDCSLHGGWAGGHHLTSVLLHVVNTFLLFVFLDRATGAAGRSAFAAALFSLHPLHVESVAWVAERKDVLSTLFWMLTLLAYLRYARAPNLARLALVAAALAAGLMAKPMLVTVPLVLLLLDLWPLGRLGKRSLRARIFEKLPLLALSAASAGVTYLVQQAGGAVQSTMRYPFVARLGNAVVTYATYLAQTLWPADLAIFYPHPGATLATWKVVASAAVLALVTALVIRERKKRPYLIVGWLWYGVTLLPVVGLVQVGYQGHADRYTYVPLVGIFVIAAWGGWDLAHALRVRLRMDRPAEDAWPRRVLSVVAVAISILLGGCSARQVLHWRSTRTIFEHAVNVRESDVAHLHLGLALEREGRGDEAIEHYRKATRVNPDTAAFYQLANALAGKGDVEGALAAYREAVRAEPWFATARYAFGILLLQQRRADEAIEQFTEAVRIDPGYAEAHFQWGMALTSLSRWQEAAAQFERAIRLQPRFAQAHYNLALTRYLTLDYRGAWIEVAAARSLGFQPEPRFLAMLEAKLPEPR